MDSSIPTVNIPLIPYYCDVVVFPSPYKENNKSWFYVLKNTAAAPGMTSSKTSFEYIPGSVYCFLPSAGECTGRIRVFSSKPSFLDKFIYCLEISPKALDFEKTDADQEDTQICSKVAAVESSERCTKCFVLHFPSPNMLQCKLKSRKDILRKMWPVRLRGGANDVEHNEVTAKGIENGRYHGIDLKAGVANLGNGNCAFETVIDTINTSDLFEESFDGTPDFWRKVWMIEVENVAYDSWNRGMTRSQWKEGWSVLKQSGNYEYELGDMVLPGIAHCVRKDIMIFNTSPQAHSPIYVVEASKLCGALINNEIPICLAYNQTHYEALVPNTLEDVRKIIELKKSFLEGTYQKRMEDLPFLTPRELFQEYLPKEQGKEVEQHQMSSEGSKKCEKRLVGAQNFQDSLPTHLRGKRPKEMTQEEKKEYNNLRRKFSRKNESKEQSSERKIKDAEYQRRKCETKDPEKKRERNEQNAKNMAKTRENESDKEKKNRREVDAKNKATQRKNESEEEKKIRNEANANNMAKTRENESEEEKKKRMKADAKNKATQRKNESGEEKKIRNEANTKNMAKRRENESDKEKKKRKEADAKNKATQRNNESSEEKKKRREANTKNMATSRENERSRETDEEAKVRKLKEKQQRAVRRAKKIPSSQYDARNAQKVLIGEQIVPELKDSEDKIGSMDTTCIFCEARKWKNETPSLCCNSGKIDLDLFPDPPPLLKKLLLEDTEEAKIFRKNTRPLNNALALSSLQVKTRQFSGNFVPNVIFEGKVCQRIGPLYPEVGEEPKFAQLYVMDPATSQTQRINNMCLPDTMTKKEINILANIMDKLQQMLKDVNPYVKDVLHICEIPDAELAEGKLIVSCKERPKGTHERKYNIQQNLTEISVLTNSLPGDMVLHKRGGGLQTIYDIHPAAQPMHFILLFPFGTKGYDAELRHTDKKTKRVSPREFFCFHINMRSSNSDFLFRFGRLFQEWVCLAFTTMESQRLKFQRNNQSSLRADSYKNIREAINDRCPLTDKVTADDHDLKLGKRIILSSSYVGSPRWFNSKFQDGMAICRKFRKPDLFITFTCNPYWKEISRELREGETVQDRPDLVSRVFKLKKDQLLKDIVVGQIFGKVVAFLWVIEFQKRGLPHAHILVILKEDDRPTEDKDIDDMISAQLPPDPELYPVNSKERKQASRLQDIVLKNMVHGPCGELNPASPCMQDGRCTKGYPKPFNSKTLIRSETTYPEYKRLDPAEGGRTIVLNTKSRQFIIDNKWIVPYSPFLSLRFNCHVNIEICFSPTASKYLFKYITKGEDRAMVRAEVEAEELVKDEIKEFIDLRSVGSSEASWHILNFNISQNKPAVYSLRVHLEDQQQVVFDMGSEEEVLEKQRCTELTAFFEYNLENPETQITYVEFPEHFTYDNKNKKWKARKNVSDTIGRIHTVHPLAGDVYYLRMLLHHDQCKGKKGFNDLLCVDDHRCESYQEVARLRGLLQDDKEWEEALVEGALTKMPSALRELFTIIIIFCQPANPLQLFDAHHTEWADDFVQSASKKGIHLTESQVRTMVVMDIQQRLQSWDKTVNMFGIPMPQQEELDAVAFTSTETYPVLIREELDFDLDDLSKSLTERKSKFTNSQRIVFETVMEAVENRNPLSLFIDARGGTGKTYVLNTILAAVRLIDNGSVALAVGTTGIAAYLLQLGRTLYSRFKVPLNITNESVCSINSQSTLANLIRMAKIIVWDEAPMSHKHQMEALDRTLRDITGCDMPFGGKVTILSGDFRQCLPVIPHANRAEVVNSALNRSQLWSNFKVLKLMENMRVLLSEDPDIGGFDAFTCTIGDGCAETIEYTDMIEIPEEMCLRIEPNTPINREAEKNSMKNLIEHVYPNLNKNFRKIGWMEGRAILAPTNK